MQHFSHEQDEFKELVDLVLKYENALIDGNLPNLSEEEYEKIIEYYLNDNSHEKALEASEIALQKFPFSSDFSISKADAFLNLGQLKNAKDTLSNIIDFNNVNYHLILSEIYFLKGKRKKAFKTLKNALIVLDEEQKDEIYLQMADFFEEEGDYGKMLKALKKALKFNPKNPETFHQLAYVYDLLEQKEKFIKLLNKNLDEDCFNVLAWHVLALQYKELGKLSEAIEAMEYLVAIEPHNQSYIEDLALLYSETYEYKKALEILLEIKKKSELSVSGLLVLGVCYIDLENYKKARLCFKEALQIDDSNPDIYFHMAKLYYLEDKYAAALPLVQKAHQGYPENIAFLDLLAHTYLGLNQLDMAIEYFHQILHLKPEKNEMYAKLAMTYFLNKDAVNAIEVLDLGIENYFFFELYYYQTVIHFSENKYLQAMECFSLGLQNCYEQHQIVFEYLPNLVEYKPILNKIEEYKP